MFTKILLQQLDGTQHKLDVTIRKEDLEERFSHNDKMFYHQSSIHSLHNHLAESGVVTTTHIFKERDDAIRAPAIFEVELDPIVGPVKQADADCVGSFAAMMKVAMWRGTDNGKSGWREPESIPEIQRLLQLAIDSRDWVSVGNYAMMMAYHGANGQ